jgi:hypothetical protein
MARTARHRGVENRDAATEWATKNITGKSRCRARSGTPVWGDRHVLTAVSADGSYRATSGVPTSYRHGTGSADGQDRVAARRAEEAPHESAAGQRHVRRRRRSPTASVIASFESRGIYASMKGTLVWQKDLGHKRMRSTWRGATPVLHGSTSSSSGITRASRSSSRSTSGPARRSGGSRGRRSTRGSRRSSSA